MPTWIVAGLGNPGPRYASTRHNVGFMVIDAYAGTKNVAVERQAHHALVGDLRIGSDRVILLKPQTYMNLSGQAVAAAARWHKVPPHHIIVVYDDVDLEVGRLRLREKGSSGGHKGMESIIAQLGTEDFPRVRIGVGRPAPGWETPDWVLSPFTSAELPIIQRAIKAAADALEVAVRVGFTQAMNQFNVRNQS